mmetsp:Transcript_6958/g.14259  ORF Transcript_6958/g.14259 Transcript_6958/m.14259 type:complete len:104 (+) Transcript_6958:79-390(+)
MRRGLYLSSCSDAGAAMSDSAPTKARVNQAGDTAVVVVAPVVAGSGSGSLSHGIDCIGIPNCGTGSDSDALEEGEGRNPVWMGASRDAGGSNCIGFVISVEYY